MSRYLERAQNVARLIDVQTKLALDLPANGGANRAEPGSHWRALMEATGNYSEFSERYPTWGPSDALRFLAFDSANRSSIRSCVSMARENARSVREMLSSEFWEQINRLYHQIEQANTPDFLEFDTEFYHRVIRTGLSFEGIVNGTMSQGEKRQWFKIGQLLERADQTSRTLDVKYFVLLPEDAPVGTPLDQIQWSGLLSSASALHAYRSAFGTIAPAHVADLMVLGRDFPRSIRYCITEADLALRNVLGTQQGYFQNPAEQKLGQLCSELSYETIEAILNFGLHEYIDQIQQKIASVDHEIHKTYFSPQPE